MSGNRERQIRQRLEAHFAPVELLIKDQSHLHAGHAGAQDGRGHFEIQIVAEAFAGKSRIERHRSVYAVLADLLQSDIHALRIKALAPTERSS